MQPQSAWVSQCEPVARKICTARAHASVSADRAQLEELATAYGNRQITFPEYLARLAALERAEREGRWR